MSEHTKKMKVRITNMTNNNELPEMGIHINEVHIHLDERMFSKNFYHPSAVDECDEYHVCCGKCNDCDDEEKLSTKELIERIHKDTNILASIIGRILESEARILDKWCNGDCDEDDEDSEEGKSGDDPADDHSSTRNESTAPVSEAGKVLASLAGLALVDILHGIVSGKEELTDES